MLFDCRLTMPPCMDALLAMLRPEVLGLVRFRCMLDTASLLTQFKAHIWRKMEYSKNAVMLEREMKLRKLDKLQRGFLYRLDLQDKATFVHYNFAAASLRRAIGLLGKSI